MPISERYECPCCGNFKWTKYGYLPSYIFGNAVEIITCEVCACGATWPPPRLKDDHYQDNQIYTELFTQKQELYVGFAKKLLKTLNGIIELKGKSLLDIGCGGGFLVQAATNSGAFADGIEANERMVIWAKRRGLNVSTSTVEELKSVGKRYDIVVLSAVLEHLERPNHLLQLCRGLLNENGVVLVSQASFDGLLPRIFPWGWYGWQPKEHYWHFSPSCFEVLVNRLNYRIIKVERNTLYHQWYRKGGVKVLLGRNLATLIARLGDSVRQGDNFNMVLKMNTVGSH